MDYGLRCKHLQNVHRENLQNTFVHRMKITKTYFSNFLLCVYSYQVIAIYAKLYTNKGENFHSNCSLFALPLKCDIDSEICTSQ